MLRHERVATVRNSLSQAIYGTEVLKLYDRITGRVPGDVNLGENGGMIGGPLLFDGLGRYGYRVHAMSNGETAGLVVLNPGRGLGAEVTVEGIDLSTHSERIFGLRTGFFDKNGELILDPERMGNDQDPWGDVAYLATVTRPKPDLAFEEGRAYNAVNNLARDIVLSGLSNTQRVLEIN